MKKVHNNDVDQRNITLETVSKCGAYPISYIHRICFFFKLLFIALCFFLLFSNHKLCTIEQLYHTNMLSRHSLCACSSIIFIFFFYSFSRLFHLLHFISFQFSIVPVFSVQFVLFLHFHRLDTIRVCNKILVYIFVPGLGQ